MFAAGTKKDPVIDTTINIRSQRIYTVAAIGRLRDIRLLPIEDPIMQIDPSKVYIRFGHLSPDAPRVDITLPDGTRLFRDVGFTEITDYIAINPGTYTLQVRPAGNKEVVLTVPNTKLTPDRFYTVYAVGLITDRPSLQVLIPLDGNSYIRF